MEKTQNTRCFGFFCAANYNMCMNPMKTSLHLLVHPFVGLMFVPRTFWKIQTS